MDHVFKQLKSPFPFPPFLLSSFSFFFLPLLFFVSFSFFHLKLFAILLAGQSRERQRAREFAFRTPSLVGNKPFVCLV